MKEPPRCAKCGKKAVSVFTPDPDVKGIGTCAKDRGDVTVAYFFLINTGREDWETVTKNWWINKRPKRA